MALIDTDIARLWFTLLGSVIALVLAILIKHSGMLELGAFKPANHQ